MNDYVAGVIAILIVLFLVAVCSTLIEKLYRALHTLRDGQGSDGANSIDSVIDGDGEQGQSAGHHHGAHSGGEWWGGGDSGGHHGGGGDSGGHHGSDGGGGDFGGGHH